MISEYDPMCEQETGKPPKCTGCHNYMNRTNSISFTWNDNGSKWVEQDVVVCYECNNCDVVINID